MSIARKVMLGTAATVTCKECGMKVGVPYATMWAMTPFVAAIIASALVDAFAMKAALWVGGFVAMAFIHVRWVPLEPR